MSALQVLHPRTPAAIIATSPQPKLQHSRREAAVMLGVSLRTIDRLIADKQLIVRRIGRRVLTSHDTLLRFIKADHQTGGAQ
jgi:excisionase family DNA binding protein